jgi:hypothetical protein
VRQWKAQSTSLTFSAVYIPPRYAIKHEEWFIPGGDYNAKHIYWGSRLITPRRCEVLKMMERNNLRHLSTAEPTYWPCDRNKLPDLLDLCVPKGIPQDFTVAKSSFDLSSGYSPVLITLNERELN